MDFSHFEQAGQGRVEKAEDQPHCEKLVAISIRTLHNRDTCRALRNAGLNLINLLNHGGAVMSFDAQSDQIAITVPYVKLLKDSEGFFDNDNELYIVSLSADESGVQEKRIAFNSAPFPNIRVGDELAMIGDGHMAYGPANPGRFVATSILFVESDDDWRAFGARLSEIMNSQSTSSVLDSIEMVNPTISVASTIISEIGKIVGNVMKKNGDDELFRTSGVFLRDRPVPYDINRKYTRHGQYIETRVQVIPLTSANGQGPQPTAAGG